MDAKSWAQLRILTFLDLDSTGIVSVIINSAKLDFSILLNASPDKIQKSGCMIFSDGKVRIAEIDSYPESLNPREATNAPAWAHVHRLIRLLDVKGESGAAAYMRHMPSHQRDSVRSLTYRLYQICDEKKMMQQAKNYNTLAVSWGQVADRSQVPATSTQATLGEF